MSNDSLNGFYIGAMVGLVLMIIVTNLPGNPANKYLEAIDQCEKDLPRSQKCAITAVPVKGAER